MKINDMKRFILIFFALISLSVNAQFFSAKRLLLSQASPESVFSMTYVSEVDVSVTQSTPDFINFKPDGSTMYLTDANDQTYQYTLSTSYLASSASYASKSHNPSIASFPPLGMVVGDSGTKYYILDRTDDKIYQYTISTAYDISTSSSASKNFTVSTSGLFRLSSDGKELVVLDATNSQFDYYDLSTAWDISTASAGTSVSWPITGVSKFTFSENGFELFITTSDKIVYLFNLSTAFDISTATQVNGSVDVSGTITNNIIDSYCLNGYLYFTDNIDDIVYQYSYSGIGTTLKTGLISVWELDENTGTTAFDSFGSNDGTNNGATINQTGVTNITPSYLFNGGTDEVDIGNILNPSLDSYTYSLWIKKTTNDVNFFLSKGNYYSTDEGFSIYTSPASPYSMRLRVNSGGGTSQRASVTYPYTSTNTWYHVVAIIDRTNDIVYAYLNGSTSGWLAGGGGPTTDDISGFGSITSTYNLFIGHCETGSGSSSATAYIDQTAIWNRVLTPAEVSTLYNSGSGLPFTSW